jgi:hypothetical protein
VRKLFSILLICCIFIYESGYMLIYIFHQVQLKEQMRAYIEAHPGEPNTVFSFEVEQGGIVDSGFKWEDEGHEFTFNNQMYDVVSMETANGKIILHAFSDQQEDKLLGAMAGHHSNTANPALTLLVSMIFTLPDSDMPFAPDQQSTTVLSSRYLPIEKTMAFDIQSPPPEIV